MPKTPIRPLSELVHPEFWVYRSKNDLPPFFFFFRVVASNKKQLFPFSCFFFYVLFCKNSFCNIIVNSCFVLHFGFRNFVFGQTIGRLLCAMEVNPRGRKQMVQHSEPIVVVLSKCCFERHNALGIRVQLHTSQLGNFGGMDHVIVHFIGAVMRTTCALFLVFFFFFFLFTRRSFRAIML